MAKSYEMVAEARAETEQVGVEEVHNALERGESIAAVDVREPEEWDAGRVPGAKLLPRGLLGYKAAEELTDKAARVVVRRAVGGRGRSPRSTSRRWATRTSPTWTAG